MEKFKIYNGRHAFYQWDVDQKLEVLDDTVTEVHFPLGTESCPPLPVYELDGQRVVDVPNILLQTDGMKRVYAYVADDLGGRTICTETFRVNGRAKPDDYIYTEAELWTAEKAVQDALQVAKDSGDFKGDKGDRGDPGPKGDKGDPGPKGEPGDIMPLAIVAEANGDIISVSDASNLPPQGLTLYGKTTQDGIPAPDAPVDLVTACDGGSVSVTVAGEYEPYKEPQTITISAPSGLNGLPMPSSANSGGFVYTPDYIDADGNAWITDYMDFDKGVYVQRFKKVTITAASEVYASINGFGRFRISVPSDRKLGSYCLCSHYPVPIDQTGAGFNNPTTTQLVYRRISSKSENLHVADDRFVSTGTTTAELNAALAEYNAWLAENPMEIIYELAEPVETPLTAEELSAYSALHTNKPNTTIYNDSNAGMKLEYIADTKTYIDNKFTELQNAILATGANI